MYPPPLFVSPLLFLAIATDLVGDSRGRGLRTPLSRVYVRACVCARSEVIEGDKWSF